MVYVWCAVHIGVCVCLVCVCVYPCARCVCTVCVCNGCVWQACLSVCGWVGLCMSVGGCSVCVCVCMPPVFVYVRACGLPSPQRREQEAFVSSRLTK